MTSSRLTLYDFLDEKYDRAKATLEREITNQSGEDALATKAWILSCELRQRKDGVIEPLVCFAAEHFASSRIQTVVATIFRLEGRVSKAVELLLAVQATRPKDGAYLAGCLTLRSTRTSVLRIAAG